MKFISILSSLCIAFALLPTGSWALTVGKTSGQEQETMSEEAALKLMDVANGLREIVPEVATEDALAIAKLISDLREDEETKMVLERLESGAIEQDAAIKKYLETATPKDVVLALNQILDDLKAVDVLFQDPARAVEAISAEGMIEEAHLPAYRENPAHLEQDMRSGLFFSFVTFASAGGYL